jgi:hypothetical protein
MRESSIIPPHIISKPYRYYKRNAVGNHRKTKKKQCAEGRTQGNAVGEIPSRMATRNFEIALPFPEE